VYIQRSNNHYFNIVFDEPISFEKSETIEDITSKLNLWLENKISLNPDQWIWTHNRWKH
jgi:lauroyl/myristoyl acyltransferase